jgi:hypothetical protein
MPRIATTRCPHNTGLSLALSKDQQHVIAERIAMAFNWQAGYQNDPMHDLLMSSP